MRAALRAPVCALTCFIVLRCRNPNLTPDSEPQPKPNNNPKPNQTKFKLKLNPIPSVAVKAKSGGKLKDFKESLEKSPPPELAALKADVEAFAKAFPTIGFEKGAMRYKD